MKAITILILSLILINLYNPIATADDKSNLGFEKGVSWKPVVPMKKVTFVNYDEKSYLDDYAYLASVPTSVFHTEDVLYSNPLLFYQDDLKLKNENEITLDASNGIDYFMKDWITYCDELDEILSINVPERKVDKNAIGCCSSYFCHQPVCNFFARLLGRSSDFTVLHPVVSVRKRTN